MVTCNYDQRQADLETSHGGQSRLKTVPLLDALSINDALLDMLNSSLRINYPSDYGEPLQLELKDLDRLRRFQARTVWTVGSPATGAIYHREVIKMVTKYPYLMHSALALTTKHDRYLQPDDPDEPERKALEYFHYGRAAALFNQRLSAKHDQNSKEHDALWAAAVFLGGIASSTVDGESPENVWPMKDGTVGEALTWLRIHEGLRVLWRISEPFAPGRMFHEMINTAEYEFMLTKLDPKVEPGIEGIPADFVELCRLDESCTWENNGYQKAVRSLVPLVDLPFTAENMLKFIAFTAMMDPRYKALLKGKDPAALVILSWWYALMLEGHWYLAKRAMLECKSICKYLARTCSDSALVQKMLDFPRTKTGLSSWTKEKGVIPDMLWAGNGVYTLWGEGGLPGGNALESRC